MKIYKFSNETFSFDLDLIFFDYSNKKDHDKVISLCRDSGLSVGSTMDLIRNCNGFFVGGSPYYLFIDTNEFDLSKKEGVIDMIKVVAHECRHVTGTILKHIGEDVTRTDSEVYQRISDWAVSKCLSTKFMKQFFKTKKSKCTK